MGEGISFVVYPYYGCCVATMVPDSVRDVMEDYLCVVCGDGIQVLRWYPDSIKHVNKLT